MIIILSTPTHIKQEHNSFLPYKNAKNELNKRKLLTHVQSKLGLDYLEKEPLNFVTGVETSFCLEYYCFVVGAFVFVHYWTPFCIIF